MLRRCAETYPDRVFLAERSETKTEWVTLTYGDALSRARSIAQGLLELGLSPGRPLMILSGNSIHHGMLMIACYVGGIPVAPVSVAYSLRSRTFDRLKQIADILRPGAVFVDDREAFSTAIEAADLDDSLLITSLGATSTGSQIDVDALLATRPGALVESAEQSLGPDTIAKILFTSGSTGAPKGVINTHRMLCSNQQALAQAWPFLQETPPVLLDWLPWSHTFGANHNFNLILKHAGTMYIDDGRPTTGMIERTVANLREVSPTISFNVPAGYAALLPYLEEDADLADRFFARLQLIFYAAASLPQNLWVRLEELSRAHTGRIVPMTTAWGTTETAPAATSAHFPLGRAGNIGVPLPGVELKLVPSEKTEVRVRGPNVTPGYWREPALTEAMFDDEGFYQTGDAVRWVKPGDPSRGLIFDGRMSEDFKLTTGTWVNVGRLRVDVLQATAPLLQDAVVCGADRDYVSVLAWLNVGEAASLSGLPPDPEALAGSDLLRDWLRERLSAHNAQTLGSSRTIKRVQIVTELPSVDAGEITDKGYINQRAVLNRRADLVEQLYSQEPREQIIQIA
jgi:feruloyl-CoA synthase